MNEQYVFLTDEELARALQHEENAKYNSRKKKKSVVAEKQEVIDESDEEEVVGEDIAINVPNLPNVTDVREVVWLQIEDNAQRVRNIKILISHAQCVKYFGNVNFLHYDRLMSIRRDFASDLKHQKMANGDDIVHILSDLASMADAFEKLKVQYGSSEYNNSEKDLELVCSGLRGELNKMCSQLDQVIRSKNVQPAFKKMCQEYFTKHFQSKPDETTGATHSSSSVRVSSTASVEKEEKKSAGNAVDSSTFGSVYGLLEAAKVEQDFSSPYGSAKKRSRSPENKESRVVIKRPRALVSAPKNELKAEDYLQKGADPITDPDHELAKLLQAEEDQVWLKAEKVVQDENEDEDGFIHLHIPNLPSDLGKKMCFNLQIINSSNEIFDVKLHISKSQFEVYFPQVDVDFCENIDDVDRDFFDAINFPDQSTFIDAVTVVKNWSGMTTGFEKLINQYGNSVKNLAEVHDSFKCELYRMQSKLMQTQKGKSVDPVFQAACKELLELYFLPKNKWNSRVVSNSSSTNLVQIIPEKISTAAKNVGMRKDDEKGYGEAKMRPPEPETQGKNFRAVTKLPGAGGLNVPVDNRNILSSATPHAATKTREIDLDEKKVETKLQPLISSQNAPPSVFFPPNPLALLSVRQDVIAAKTDDRDRFSSSIKTVEIEILSSSSALREIVHYTLGVSDLNYAKYCRHVNTNSQADLRSNRDRYQRAIHMHDVRTIGSMLIDMDENISMLLELHEHEYADTLGYSKIDVITRGLVLELAVRIQMLDPKNSPLTSENLKQLFLQVRSKEGLVHALARRHPFLKALLPQRQSDERSLSVAPGRKRGK